MLTVKYFIVWISVLVAQLFLGTWATIGVWCLAGVIIAAWCREARRPWLFLAGTGLSTVLIACGIIYFTNTFEILQFAQGIHYTPLTLILSAIAVNAVTAVLCSTTFMTATRLILRPRP